MSGPARLRAAIAHIAIVVLVVAPLIAGSIWIYQASAGAFSTQRELRIAQNARNALKTTFLASEADVRGYAATRDPYFAQAYGRDHRAFPATASALRSDLAALRIDDGAASVLESEQENYARWMRRVAAPILDGRSGAATGRILRAAGAPLAAGMIADDRRLGAFLDDAAQSSEIHRQTLLRRILVASVTLVLAAAAVVAVLLEARAAAARRELRAAVLYEDERRITRLLQGALAPDPLPALSGADLKAMYVPAAYERAVGGDWYEALQFGDGRVLLLIGDVVGHGLEAAVVMNHVRQALLAAAVTSRDPALILTHANTALASQSSGLVTAACCIVDPFKRRLAYATAGHPPPVVAGAAPPAAVLRNGGPPLGVVDDLDLHTYELDLGRHSLLVLYTDGLVENDRDPVKGEQRLLVAVQDAREAADPPQAIYNAMIDGTMPRDDVAILSLRM